MRLVSQGHEILFITPDALERIEQSGRVCWQSEGRSGPGTAPAFVRNLRTRNHSAMLEFADMTVRFTTNRGVSHELVRHRLCSFAQMSTRYCEPEPGEEMECIRPVWWSEWQEGRGVIFQESMNHAESSYRRLRKAGASKEQAREVLPNALKTIIDVKANLRQWRKIFALRGIGATGKPHPQMQALILPLLDEAKTKIPVVFDDLVVG